MEFPPCLAMRAASRIGCTRLAVAGRLVIIAPCVLQQKPATRAGRFHSSAVTLRTAAIRSVIIPPGCNQPRSALEDAAGHPLAIESDVSGHGCSCVWFP